MNKISLEFIFNIIQSHISGYIKEYHEGLLTVEEMRDKIEALSRLDKSLQEFLQQLNRLGG